MSGTKYIHIVVQISPTIHLSNFFHLPPPSAPALAIITLLSAFELFFQYDYSSFLRWNPTAFILWWLAILVYWCLQGAQLLWHMP